MPQIPEAAANLALHINSSATPTAVDLLGLKQYAQAGTLKPEAIPQETALKTLIEEEKLQISPEGQIEVTSSPAKLA